MCDTYGYLRVFVQVPGDQLRFEFAQEIAKLEPTRLTAERVDWNGDGWDDLLASYANDRIYVLVNRAVAGRPTFEPPRLLKVPPCYGDPWPYVGDWNHDGDADLIIDQYGYTRFVERSFIEYGYRPATRCALRSSACKSNWEITAKGSLDHESRSHSSARRAVADDARGSHRR